MISKKINNFERTDNPFKVIIIILILQQGFEENMLK